MGPILEQFGLYTNFGIIWTLTAKTDPQYLHCFFITLVNLFLSQKVENGDLNWIIPGKPLTSCTELCACAFPNAKSFINLAWGCIAIATHVHVLESMCLWGKARQFLLYLGSVLRLVSLECGGILLGNHWWQSTLMTFHVGHPNVGRLVEPLTIEYVVLMV